MFKCQNVAVKWPKQSVGWGTVKLCTVAHAGIYATAFYW